jgi:deoxyribonuclease V
MRPELLRHAWDLTAEQAARLQEKLSRLVIEADEAGPVRAIAGADVSSGRDDDHVRAAVVVLDATTLRPIDLATALGETSFPYRGGYRSFRELPTLLAAFDRLHTRPDLVLCAGHGRAHPRRLGLACHLGLWLDLPTIGCADRLLAGTCRLPGARRGCHRRLLDAGQVVGEVVRTRSDVSPLFVSIGHRISLASARKWVLHLARRYRLPEPLRAARSEVRRLRHGPD